MWLEIASLVSSENAFSLAVSLAIIKNNKKNYMPNIRSLEKKDFQQVIKLFPHDPIGFDGNALINDKGINCIVVENEGIIIGFASLIIYRIPTKGLVARIEDVVVDDNHRGKGYGKLLTQELLKIAKSKNIHEINLTSRPIRGVARSLYESIGFKLRDTGEFRLIL